ncbi:ACR081Cp [Eremothecium gossypii ATCC 10895]|uniref:ACR081Cp n=1 Tax=Eremothecium gossypii (strain ATCC 10895 / CBS 109.51 / FGSC 9923 / NRRL Y-1056) TaxID=284811 RepID=Q75C36_EREGS|nr:ACR081Cp [Eremothecium gossypii ATCC 10895]AAS51307.1 ACR081Cp [Eremothecium gossypii ATCC 10895]AEY95599.1 FACR081Cp [Eremothecium gossypii FDAG1]
MDVSLHALTDCYWAVLAAAAVARQVCKVLAWLLLGPLVAVYAYDFCLYVLRLARSLVLRPRTRALCNPRWLRRRLTKDETAALVVTGVCIVTSDRD